MITEFATSQPNPSLQVADLELDAVEASPEEQLGSPAGSRNSNRIEVPLDLETVVVALSGDDPDHSALQRRQVTFGMSAMGRLLVIAHTERGANIRIISARPATRAETKIYEEG